MSTQARRKDANRRLQEKVGISSQAFNATKEEVVDHVVSNSTLDEKLSLHDHASNTTGTVLAAANNTTNATIYDPMYGAARLFDSKHIQPNPHATYGTTIGLILLLHVIFVHQWNARKSRKDVLTSFQQVVRKRKFYRFIVAVLSHPPSTPTTRERNSSRLSLRSLLQPLSTGHLSGLPLLTYNSHILWSCRALEAMCPSSWSYARLLLTLTLVAFLLELRTSHVLLQTSGNLGATPTESRFIGKRTLGTPTMLTAALLMVYGTVLPHVPIPILPLFPRMNATVSYCTCLLMLTALSYKSHAFTSIVFGTVSGFLLVSKVTFFFTEYYWGSVLVAWLVVASLVSLKASAGSLAAWVPCVDHVAWDAQGQVRLPEGETNTLQDDDEEENDDEQQEEDIESQALLRSESSGLHGRVPMMDMDDDLMPDTRPTPRGVSQRRGRTDASASLHR